MYQSMGFWDRVLDLNYGTYEGRRKPGAVGSGVLLAVVTDGTTLWTLPDRYILFPAQQNDVGL